MSTPNHQPDSEPSQSPESPHYTKDQVIAAFRGFIDRGLTNPDDLDPDDPEVIEANHILDAWNAQLQKDAQEAGTPEADLEYALNRSTIMVDAGFSDPEYLDEVANDWLGGNNLPEAEEKGFTELAAKIRAKIDEINKQVESQS